MTGASILICGPGAVGLGVASCLLAAGERVHILGRAASTAMLAERGLGRTGIFGPCHAEPSAFSCFTSLDVAPELPYEYVLVCTKSYDSATVCEQLASSRGVVGRNTRIVLFQNGWGNAEVFSRVFPETAVYNARVITGFQRQDKARVEVTVHADAICIGSLYTPATDCIERLVNLISRGGIPCRSTAQIGKHLWAKMLYNCTLNPLGAIFGVPYGVLGRQPHTRAIMADLVAEIFAVISALGYETHWASPDQYLTTFYEKLLPPTAAHESSMLQDIRARRRTEIDALSGEIIRLGNAACVATTCNRMTYRMVKFLEADRSRDA